MRPRGLRQKRGTPEMRLYLDTSAPTCVVRLDEREYRWEAGRDLAEGLLAFLRDKLAENQATWQDIREITFFTGPGSFTGLRIGATVVNTLAHELQVPLFDQDGREHPLILPNYGRPARVTPPRK